MVTEQRKPENKALLTYIGGNTREVGSGKGSDITTTGLRSYRMTLFVTGQDGAEVPPSW